MHKNCELRKILMQLITLGMLDTDDVASAQKSTQFTPV